MTEASEAPPDRLDELMKEVRRQGRAAVAAQAAAESCLEQVSRLAERSAEPGAGDPERSASRDALVRALLPFADALERVAAAASSAGPPPPPPSVLDRLLGRPQPGPVGPGGLAEGVRLLRAQLDGILESAGIAVDREVGVAIDPERHRVVEVRLARRGERPGTVVSIARPGYAIDGRLLREADVVVTAQEGKR